jgi:hypothetical protein
MKQIKVIAPAGKPGTVADVTELLADRGINIHAIDVTDDHAHGIILLEVDSYDDALRALGNAGYDAVSEEVILVRIKDEPGALAKIAARFRDPMINISAMRIVRRDGGWASVILSTEDNAAASELLKDCRV